MREFMGHIWAKKLFLKAQFLPPNHTWAPLLKWLRTKELLQNNQRQRNSIILYIWTGTRNWLQQERWKSEIHTNNKSRQESSSKGNRETCGRHGYFVVTDVFWPKFKSEYPHSILTLDYSENIEFKFEAQSTHFSRKQQTLHCCVHEKGDDIKYLYHLSDDKIHDSVMTLAVIENIIEHDPSTIESGILLLRSDNCPTR